MGDLPQASESILYTGECPYESGELVTQSGIYAICHADGRRQTVVLLSGDQFPECDCCGHEVRYRLLRSAPYIFDDEDFAPTA
jgi:hypothetical protein